MPEAAAPAAAVLRRARAEDAPALAALARWVWLQTYAGEGLRPSFLAYLDQAFTPAILEALMAREDQPMWLLEQGPHLLAWTHLALDQAPPPDCLRPSPRQAELVRLYVAPPCSGQGHGARLLTQARRALPQHGLWLRAWEGNAGALRFYRRERARLLGETWFELEGERHRNEVLGWCAWQEEQAPS